MALVVTIRTVGFFFQDAAGLRSAGFVVDEADPLVGGQAVDTIDFTGEWNIVKKNLGSQRQAEIFLGEEGRFKFIPVMVVVGGKSFLAMNKAVFELAF